MLAEPVWKAGPQKVTALYTKAINLLVVFPSSAGSGKAGVNLRGPPRKPKYCQATDSEPNYVEHPSGVIFKRTPPEATRHMVNAIAIARDIKQRYGALPPGCAKACDGVLK